MVCSCQSTVEISDVPTQLLLVRISTMSKSHQLMDCQHPGPSRESVVKTDWNRCILCQEVTSEILQCPAESKRHDVGIGQGYSTLSSNIVRFSELCELPMPIDLGRLDEGSGMEGTLLEHKAKWHKSCRTKFNVTKLVRAEKRKLSNEDSDPDYTIPRKNTRRSGSRQAHTTNVCFFVKMHQHRNHSMRHLRFTWTIVYGSVHLFYKMNNCLQNLVLEI
jgi:hypothetical protein